MKKQLELNIYKGKNGGRRPGAGRPRKHSKGVAHTRREKVTASTPLHINFKYNAFIRTPGMLQNLQQAINNASEHDFEVIHFTIQSNHIHLIAETKNNLTLEKGMRSLTNTIVKLFQKGSIQIGRYHLHVLKTPNEVKNALEYVINNDLKHTGRKIQKYTQYLQQGNSWLLKASGKKSPSSQHFSRTD